LAFPDSNLLSVGAVTQKGVSVALHRVLQVLQRVYCDKIGPSHVDGLKGERYCFMYTDDHSGYTTGYCIVEADTTTQLDCTKKFKITAEQATGMKLREPEYVTIL
jgi:hypothetical protein